VILWIDLRVYEKEAVDAFMQHYYGEFDGEMDFIN
jgi:hypothetical protein